MSDTFAVDALAASAGGTWLRRPVVDRVSGVGTDTRADLGGRLFVAIRGARHDGHDHVADAIRGDAAAVMIDRDVAPDMDRAVDGGQAGVLRVDDTVAALGWLGAAHRATLVDTAVVAITGSAGKTTTKQLVHAALRETLPGRAAPRSFNNDIGVPLTLLAARPGDRSLVVEIGTNAPGEVATLAAMCRPDVAVITLVGHSHLEGLGGIEAVAREKLSLLAHLARGGAAVLNADCPRLRGARRAGPTVLYGTSADAHVRLTGRGRDDGERGWWLELDDGARFDVPAPGRHIAMNTLAAIAVARHLGVDDDAIRRGLAGAELPSMRLAVETIGGARIWNDAYNANPESMQAALETFGDEEAGASRRLLVLGDMLELGAAAPSLHRALAADITRLNERAPLHRVHLVGPLCRHTAGRLSASLDVHHADDLDMNAIDIHPGDAVLVKASRGMSLERSIARLREQALATTSGA